MRRSISYYLVRQINWSQKQGCLIMSDTVDRANEYAELVLEQNIQAMKKAIKSVSAFECENCEHPNTSRASPSSHRLHIM